MKTDHQTGQAPGTPPAVSADPGLVSQLQAECERLRQRLAEVEAERDQYRAEVYAWARKELERDGPLNEDELKRQIENGEGQPLEAFFSELERVAKGS